MPAASDELTRSVEFGIAIPQTGATNRSEVASLATRAEGLGYHALWVSELTTAPILDPLILLAHAAALTQRIRLGVAVILTPLRIPYQLARELASLDRLCDGRLTVGVGFGSKPEIYPRYGLSADRRLRRYLDGLDLLRLLWTRREVAFDGECWQIRGETNLVRPAQRPHPPLWFGARREPALRRAVKLGDGWIGSGVADPDEFVRSLEVVRAQLEALRRNPAEFTIAKRVYVAVSDGQPEQDRRRMRAWFAANYGNPSLCDHAAVVGPPEQCAERISQLIDAGVQHLILNPVFNELDQAEALTDGVIATL